MFIYGLILRQEQSLKELDPDIILEPNTAIYYEHANE